MEERRLGLEETGGSFSQLEDKVMKTAIQFFGEDLLPYVGVKGKIDSVAPTEHVHLELRRLEEDFNFIMRDASWRHLEFESDSITVRDLRRFREYDAYIGLTYNVPVITTVLCTSDVRILKKELINGDSIYRVELVRLRDRDADKVFRKLEHKVRKGKVLRRHDMVPVLLTPMMSGKMDIGQRICRAIDFLQLEELDMKEEDTKRMLSVLYALSVKFLDRDQLKEVKERIGMTVLGQMLLEEGIEKGIEKGYEQGIEQGIEQGVRQGIRALILDNMEEGIPKERIIEKLCRRFSLKEEEAELYYKRFSDEEKDGKDYINGTDGPA